MPKERVTIENDEAIETHIAFEDLGYTTLCGMDGSDPGINQNIVEPTGRKVTCAQCFALWQGARGWQASDFKTN